ncbi:MAG: hypothetical protein BGP04_03360 [Rhizobiales bacterium 62-17]|nr:hypothetical protein [Hyphomicrobiales bacterium]OJY04447.1 MAG: hypothetical protein BGP04_03360 [Rhizobiales bacterium 62-17]
MTTKSKTAPASSKAISKPTSGWAVSVTFQPVDGDGPVTEETFYAAIVDREEAEKAVAQLAGAADDATVKADKRISAAEFEDMGWHAGQVEQWVGPSLEAPGS